MKSIPKQGYDPNILVKQAMKRIQNVMVGGFLEKLTLFEVSLILSSSFIQSISVISRWRLPSIDVQLYTSEQ